MAGAGRMEFCRKADSENKNKPRVIYVYHFLDNSEQTGDVANISVYMQQV
jgi:hypothetical protein